VFNHLPGLCVPGVGPGASFVVDRHSGIIADLLAGRNVLVHWLTPAARQIDLGECGASYQTARKQQETRQQIH
jgi:hypothetical protein